MSWIPLHVHSQYSILDSTASVGALAERAAAHRMSALGLTDQGNLYGAVEFYKACKALGVQPLIGMEIWLAPKKHTEKQRQTGVPNGFPILLFAKNYRGYQNLCKLSSIGFLEGFYYQPRIDRELLEALHEGLICLSGPVQGLVGHLILQGQEEALRREVDWYQKLFGSDYYLQLERTGCNEALLREDGVDLEPWLGENFRDFVEKEARCNQKLVQLSKELSIPLVATHSIHYLERGDWRAHEILLNIQSGETAEIWERDSRGVVKQKMANPKRKVALSHEFYFRSSEEMERIFFDLPEAIAETQRIAAKCAFAFDFQTKHYPLFTPPVEAGQDCSAATFLYQLCEAAIPVRYSPAHLEEVRKKYPGRVPLEVVRERFEYEFKVLQSKEMCDYLLIVYDFIHWAKGRKIPVGPGRGSAAGSIIAYLTAITDIEPLRFHLFFERFINPERVSYPDIDVDICMDRRQEVIDYTVGKYGKERVAQIITFGTMKAKMAIRDVGRVLNIPLSRVNEIAALVPEDPTMTLERALQMDPEFQRLEEMDEEAGRLLAIARKAEGSIRNTSTHAAGLIISKTPLTDHLPVCTAKDSSMLVTQYAMKPVESIGMLKIDFLGLKTLTCLQKCVDAIGLNRGQTIDWTQLPLQDAKTFELLCQGRTKGVFQMESEGMTDLARQLRVDSFEEIIAVVALYRPGPMELIPSFIARKQGREAIEIDHPLMKNILAETYGIMVYQEQVMQIASALAGYSLGEGDVLRRAMGKKDKEEMSRQREKFSQGAVARGLDALTATSIFDKIEKFASYGFNKSHAAAYAYLSYATAFFKANFPSEWLAALMTCDLHDLTQVAEWIAEASLLHIPVLPPHVNAAGSEFVSTQEGIRFAMSGIKGVGGAVVEAIIEARRKGGLFQNLYDLIQRVDKSRVTKKGLELLIDAGSFDQMGWPRDAMRESLDAMYQQACRDQKEASLGILNLFSLIEEVGDVPFRMPPPILKPSSQRELLQREKELLGFFLTGHPLTEYATLFRRLSVVPLGDLCNFSDGSVVRIAVLMDEIDVKISGKTQKKFAIVSLSDQTGRIELPIWSEMYEEKAGILKKNQILYLIIQMERREGRALSLQCRWMEELALLDEAKIRLAETLYEKFKTAKGFESKKRGAPMKEKEKEKDKERAKEQPLPLQLTVDANQMRLTDILQLKKIFRASPGPSPVEILFMASGRKVGLLQIDASWGVQLDAALQEALRPFR